MQDRITIRSAVQPQGDRKGGEIPMATVERWKHDGVRVIPGTELDPNTPQTPGMDRKAAITFARVGGAEAMGVSFHRRQRG